MIILKSLHISNHAKERYAERNMHATKLEVPMFVDKYDTKIQDDISKMVEYGELIYTGNNPAQEHRKQNSIVNIYLCTNWMVLVDAESNTVITLFEKDQCVQDMFDEFFSARDEFEEISQKITDENKELQQLITQNDEQIKEANDRVRRLQQDNKRLKDQITTNFNRRKSVKIKMTNLFDKIIRNY